MFRPKLVYCSLNRAIFVMIHTHKNKHQDNLFYTFEDTLDWRQPLCLLAQKID